MSAIDAAGELRAARRLGAAGWERVQTCATLVFCGCALTIAFWRGTAESAITAAVYMTLCTVFLGLSRVLRVVLHDLFAQFQYREKLALFLVHACAMMAPWYFGIRGWQHALAVLLALLCLQAIDRVVFGRLYTVGALLVLGSLMGAYRPPFAFVGVWMLSLLVAFRAEHIRFALEGAGRVAGVRPGDALRESLLAVLAPLVAAGGCYVYANRAFRGTRRGFDFDPGPFMGGGRMGGAAHTGLILDAVILCALIVGSLLLLHWVEHKFRRTRKGEMKEDPDVSGVMEERGGRTADVEPTPSFEEGADARGRMLRRFRMLAHALARHPGETPREFLARVARDLLHGDTLPESAVPAVDRAAYSRLPFSDDEAAETIARLDEIEQRAEKERIRAEEKSGRKEDER